MITKPYLQNHVRYQRTKMILRNPLASPVRGARQNGRAPSRAFGICESLHERHPCQPHSISQHVHIKLLYVVFGKVKMTACCVASDEYLSNSITFRTRRASPLEASGIILDVAGRLRVVVFGEDH